MASSVTQPSRVTLQKRRDYRMNSYPKVFASILMGAMLFATGCSTAAKWQKVGTNDECAGAYSLKRQPAKRKPGAVSHNLTIHTYGCLRSERGDFASEPTDVFIYGQGVADTVLCNDRIELKLQKGEYTLRFKSLGHHQLLIQKLEVSDDYRTLLNVYLGAEY